MHLFVIIVTLAAFATLTIDKHVDGCRVELGFANLMLLPNAAISVVCMRVRGRHIEA